jgi:hypothetical protein
MNAVIYCYPNTEPVHTDISGLCTDGRSPDCKKIAEACRKLNEWFVLRDSGELGAEVSGRSMLFVRRAWSRRSAPGQGIGGLGGLSRIARIPRTQIKVNGMPNAAIRFNKANTILESDMIQGCSRLVLLGPHPSRSQACSNDHR